MTRLQRWFVQWLRAWPTSASRSRQPVALDAALAEVVAARTAHDTRRLHAAHERARRERTRALAHELGREVFSQ